MIDVRAMLDEAIAVLANEADDGNHMFRHQRLHIGAASMPNREYREYRDESVFDEYVFSMSPGLNRLVISLPFGAARDIILFDDRMRWTLCRFNFFTGRDMKGRLAVKAFYGSRTEPVRMCTFIPTFHQVVELYLRTTYEYVYPQTLTMFGNFDHAAPAQQLVAEAGAKHVPPVEFDGPWTRADVESFVENPRSRAKAGMDTDHWKKNHDTEKISETIRSWDYDLGKCLVSGSRRGITSYITEHNACLLWSETEKSIFEIYFAGLWDMAVAFNRAKLMIPMWFLQQTVRCEETGMAHA